MPASLRSPAPHGLQTAGSGKFNARDISTQRKAEGSIVFAANLVAGDIVIVNGVSFLAKASGAAGNEFNVDTTLTLTLDALVTALNASAVAAVAVATYSKVSTTTLKVVYDTAVDAGNLFTLNATLATPVTSKTAYLVGGGASDVDDGKTQAYIVTTYAGNVGAFVLKDGQEGEIRSIILKTAGANLVVSGAFAATTAATFDAANDMLVLQWLADKWRVITNIGAVSFA